MLHQPILRKAKSFLLLILFLLLFFLLLRISGAITPKSVPDAKSNPKPTIHKTYNYESFIMPSAADNLSPGSQLQVVWKPQPDVDSPASTPDILKIDARLIGPYVSIVAAREATNDVTCATIFRKAAVSALTIQTDSWTNKTYTSTLQLPQNLTPGYYTLLQVVTENGVDTSGCGFSQAIATVKAKS